MFMELAKPVTLIVCILSLYAVFYAAFLDPASAMEERICESLALLMAAGVISVASALFFRDTTGSGAGTARLKATLPVQMFCWVSGIMVVLFLLAWYLQINFVFYRDLRWY